MALERSLTVKLRGRAQARDKRHGRTLSFRAHGANQTTHHGPLQRLLETHRMPDYRSRFVRRRLSRGEVIVYQMPAATISPNTAETITVYPAQAAVKMPSE